MDLSTSKSKALTASCHLVTLRRMTIDEWMTWRGLSDTQVALLLKVDRSMVSRLRRRQRTPSAKLMGDIMRVSNGAVMPNDWIQLPATPVARVWPSDEGIEKMFSDIEKRPADG